MKVWRAFRAMLGAAARDPLWALFAVPLNLFRAGKCVLSTILAGGLVLFVLTLVANWITGQLGFKGQRDPPKSRPPSQHQEPDCPADRDSQQCNDENELPTQRVPQIRERT